MAAPTLNDLEEAFHRTTLSSTDEQEESGSGNDTLGNPDDTVKRSRNKNDRDEMEQNNDDGETSPPSSLRQQMSPADLNAYIEDDEDDNDNAARDEANDQDDEGQVEITLADYKHYDPSSAMKQTTIHDSDVELGENLEKTTTPVPSLSPSTSSSPSPQQQPPDPPAHTIPPRPPREKQSQPSQEQFQQSPTKHDKRKADKDDHDSATTRLPLWLARLRFSILVGIILLFMTLVAGISAVVTYLVVVSANDDNDSSTSAPMAVPTPTTLQPPTRRPTPDNNQTSAPMAVPTPTTLQPPTLRPTPAPLAVVAIPSTLPPSMAPQPTISPTPRPTRRPTRSPTPQAEPELPENALLLAYDLFQSTSLRRFEFDIEGPDITSLSSGFGIYRYGQGPFAVEDATVRFPTDQGGIVQSTNVDLYFGIVNTAINSFWHPRTAVWTFDVEQKYVRYFLSVDMGAMGQPFTQGSFFSFAYQWQSSVLEDQDESIHVAFEGRVDSNRAQTYTMEFDQVQWTYGGTMLVDANVVLNNHMRTLVTELSLPDNNNNNNAAVDQLRLTLTASSANAVQAMAFQNILIHGVVP